MEETLGFWRDVSIVFLSPLVVVMLAVPLFILYFAQKYLRLARKRLVLPLKYGQLWAIRIQNATLIASDRAVSVPIGLRARAASARGALRRLQNRRQ